MVFHSGRLSLHHAKTSVMSRSEGRGGKIYVPRAMYSFSTSCWMVPPTFARSAPCFFAAATYIASKIEPVALMVIEVVTLSRGSPSVSASMSASDEIATPTLPTSPSACGSSES